MIEVLRQLEIIVIVDALFAQWQSLKGPAVFYLPPTQSGPTWHNNAATTTDWGKKKEDGNMFTFI